MTMAQDGGKVTSVVGDCLIIRDPCEFEQKHSPEYEAFSSYVIYTITLSAGEFHHRPPCQSTKAQSLYVSDMPVETTKLILTWLFFLDCLTMPMKATKFHKMLVTLHQSVCRNNPEYRNLLPLFAVYQISLPSSRQIDSEISHINGGELSYTCILQYIFWKVC